MIAVASMLQLSSCLKNEVDVEVKLSSSITDAYRLRYYASDQTKGWYVDGAIPVDKGVGNTKVYTKSPTIVTIMHGSNEMEAGFYAERGDKIVISGNNADPYSWRIKGNKITEAWSDWRIENKSILQEKDAEKINKAVKAYVAKHNDNPLSTILLLLYYNRSINDDEFRKLWDTLEGDAASPALIKLIGRSDILESKPIDIEPVKTLIVKTRDTGVDTLLIGKSPLLLMFTRNSDSGHNDDMLALRRVREIDKDSTKFMMGELSFDLDSVSWANRLPLDSLSGVLRGWIPRGETDSVVGRLGVERTPFIIIFDKKGKVLYRGSDVPKGLGEYEKLLKKNVTKS